MYRPSINIVFIGFVFLLVRNHYSKSATAFGRKCQIVWEITQGLLFGLFSKYMQHPSGMQKYFVRPGKLCFEIKCSRSRNIPTALEGSRIMYSPSLYDWFSWLLKRLPVTVTDQPDFATFLTDLVPVRTETSFSTYILSIIIPCQTHFERYWYRNGAKRKYTLYMYISYCPRMSKPLVVLSTIKQVVYRKINQDGFLVSLNKVVNRMRPCTCNLWEHEPWQVWRDIRIHSCSKALGTEHNNGFINIGTEVGRKLTGRFGWANPGIWSWKRLLRLLDQRQSSASLLAALWF